MYCVPTQHKNVHPRINANLNIQICSNWSSLAISSSKGLCTGVYGRKQVHLDGTPALNSKLTSLGYAKLISCLAGNWINSLFTPKRSFFRHPQHVGSYYCVQNIPIGCFKKEKKGFFIFLFIGQQRLPIWLKNHVFGQKSHF